MNDSIHVQIDADLEEIIPHFLNSRRQDIVSLETLLNKKDYGAIQILGHSMKGAGASYGFQLVSDIGKAIEQAAKKGSAQVIAAKKSELESFLDRVRIEFIRE